MVFPGMDYRFDGRQRNDSLQITSLQDFSYMLLNHSMKLQEWDLEARYCSDHCVTTVISGINFK